VFRVRFLPAIEICVFVPAIGRTAIWHSPVAPSSPPRIRMRAAAANHADDGVSWLVACRDRAFVCLCIGRGRH